MGNKIPVASLLSDFQRMLAERWAYGAETKRGQVDCSGAFVWSYRRHGRGIYHGSNRIAREEVTALIPIGEATLQPGMAAFKRRAPGERGYALPAAYRPGGAHHNGDLGDYYHIGLIDTDASRVLNAQSAATGFVASPVSQGWTHVGRLTQVAYADSPDHPTLRRGSAGETVREAQRLLMALGYSLPRWGADGKYGDETITAVRAFQRAHGLSADGVIGPLTWAQLKEVTS